MIKGTSTLEVFAELTKPAKNQNKEIAHNYFKSANEIAIASLRNGYNFAVKIGNAELAELIAKDINMYVDIFNQREFKEELKTNGQ